MTEIEEKLDLWVREIHKGSVSLAFQVKETLFSDKSLHQRVDIVKTVSHGAMLLNDGMIMLSERDEFIYHEMIAHVPLFVHPEPRRVLIIGGGDGGTAREVLRHEAVERVVMVEIDEMVVEACRRHIPSVSGALDNPRLTILIDDGVRFVKETAERFDLILIDSTDPVGPAQPLFDSEFYGNVASRLAENGIMIAQAESPFYDAQFQATILSGQRPHFKRLHLYNFSNMTYPGGLWSFTYASNGLCPIGDFDPDRVVRSGIKTRYYNPRVHRAAFSLPEFMNEKLSGLLDPLPG